MATNVKILVVGDTGVGKTSIIRRFVTGELPPPGQATIGIEFFAKAIDRDGKSYRLQLWDTCGQERFRTLTRAYYRGAHGIVLVFDVTDFTSFSNLDEWLKEIREGCDSEPNIILVGNKSDLAAERQVTSQDAINYASTLGVTYIETSALAVTNIEAVYESLVFGTEGQNRLYEGKPVRDRPIRHITAGTVELPLVSIHADCHIHDVMASVEITQVYKNTSVFPQELVVGFPIEEFGSVCKFEGVKSNGDIIIGKVLEKQEAINQYDDAISEGKTAILLEEGEGNVFKASVGLLLPEQTMTLHISYVTELRMQRKWELKFVFKTLMDYTGTNARRRGATVQTAFPQATLEATIHAKSAITGLKTYTHKEARITKNGSEGVVKVDSGLMDSNFELRIALEDPFAPTMLIEHNGQTSSYAAMVTLIPKLNTKKDTFEFIFVIDRSGSMQGKYWNTAASALQIFLRSLPIGCYFNVIGFGTRFEAIFGSSVKYDGSTLLFASSVLQSWTANLGGTDMEHPLNWLYKQKVLSNVHRRVVFITDGQASNEGAVLLAVRNATSKFCRTFCLGIGNQVSREFLSTAAVNGRGYCEFSEDPDALELKVVRQLKRTMGLEVSKVEANWGNFPTSELQDKEPENVDGIFIGGKIVLFSLLENRTLSTSDSQAVCVDITYGNGETNTYVVEMNSASNMKGDALHALAVKHFIRQKLLKRTATTRKEVVKLSTKYGIASIYAAFVGVETKASGQAVEGTMERVDMTMPGKQTNQRGIASRVGETQQFVPDMLKIDAPSEQYKSAGCCGNDAHYDRSYHSIQVYTEPSAIYKEYGMAVRPLSPPTPLTLEAVVFYQSYDGSWSLLNVASMLSCSEETLDSANVGLTKSGEETNNCWATAIAIAFLEIKFIKDHEKWDMLTEKAYQYLEAHIPATNSGDEWRQPEQWVVVATKYLHDKKVVVGK